MNTQFKADDPDNEVTDTAGYDFDNDGTQDTIIAGRFGTDANGDKIFEQGIDGVPRDKQLQGIWLSGGDRTPGQDLPDLTRLIDSKSFAELDNQGLLETISAEDLRNTDIYVVRASDGKLIAERIGLNEYEANRVGDLGEDSEKHQFFYTMQMRNSFSDTFRFCQRWLPFTYPGF